jgi:uncharacterized phage protein (TIGR01671 family)
MSREIKFRAWDNYSKSFIQDNEYLIGLDGKFYRMDFYSGIENYEDGSLVWDELQNITLSQFTGLKDKNGKEIFEGDILSHRYYSKPVLCEFVDGSFIFDDISKYDKSLEVIGNIYQNPELLGGENE